MLRTRAGANRGTRPRPPSGCSRTAARASPKTSGSGCSPSRSPGERGRRCIPCGRTRFRCTRRNRRHAPWTRQRAPTWAVCGTMRSPARGRCVRHEPGAYAHGAFGQPGASDPAVSSRCCGSRHGSRWRSESSSPARHAAGTDVPSATGLAEALLEYAPGGRTTPCRVLKETSSAGASLGATNGGGVFLETDTGSWTSRPAFSAAPSCLVRARRRFPAGTAVGRGLVTSVLSLADEKGFLPVGLVLTGRRVSSREGALAPGTSIRCSRFRGMFRGRLRCLTGWDRPLGMDGGPRRLGDRLLG